MVETEGVVSPVTEGASVEKNDLVDRHAADVMGIARGMLAEAKWIDGEYIVPAAGAASFRYTVYTTVGGVVKMLLWYNAPSGTTNTIIRVLPGEWLAAAEHLTRG